MKVCPSCKGPYDENMKFCRKCGVPLINENIDLKNRNSIFRLITVSVVILEMFIFACTLVYQPDGNNRIETPITKEIAKLYIDHPDKLKVNERIAMNGHTYFLITVGTTKVNPPFPWKGWTLISIGMPVGIFLLVALITKIYFQAIKPDFKKDEENADHWILALNRLSKSNVIWFWYHS